MTDQEIVRLLAERVMGWKLRALALTSGIFDAPDGSTWHWPNSFDPLTSISDAFQVVEKMREKGWYCVITTPGALPSCSARFGHLNKPHARTEYRDPAGRVAKSICLAAIAAIGEEKS